MLDEYLFCDWDEAPSAMDFEKPYLESIERCAGLVEAILSYGPEGAKNSKTWSLALELFVTVPAIVNVMLNYHICIGLGLPLHPTEYFEVDSEKPAQCAYPSEMAKNAFFMYETAIKLAVSAYALKADFPIQVRKFGSALPSSLGAFIYTSKGDKYTWRGSEPAKVKALAGSILRNGRPDIAIGLEIGRASCRERV